ncbi:MAG: site-specific integrase [Bacilli bacterium]|nr:site-specific integrase [Bacilli bacterium]
MQTSFLSPTSTLPPGIKFDEAKRTYKVDLIRVYEGKRTHIYCSNLASLEDALKAKEELLRQKASTLRIEAFRMMTFDSFFDRYIEYRSLHVRNSSLSQALSVKNKYFRPYLSSPAIDALSPSHIESTYHRIVDEESLTPSWKNRIIGILRNMVGIAFKWKILDASDYQDETAILENIPEHFMKKERIIWNKEEERRFLRVTDNSPHKVMFRLFMELGARLGEFLGLTWEAYDAKKGVISIKKQLLYNSQKSFVLSDVLKTRESYRTCKLSSEMKFLLNEYKKTCPSSTYMFPCFENSRLPLSKAAFRGAFNRYIAKAKVRRITPHAIRHAKATKLLKACRNMLEVKAVARYMGHSAAMMMNVYSHAEMSTIENVLARIEPLV